jgi:hypothetical protein
MNLIEEIENWYLSQCDGDWEHDKGIELTTIDNPGWRLRVNLIDTSLQSHVFERLETERDKNDWFHCWIKDGFFEAACGPKNLEEVLGIFIEWAKTRKVG